MTKVVCDYVLKINSKDNTFPKCFGKVDSDCYGLVWSETSFQEEEDELDLKNGRILKGAEKGPAGSLSICENIFTPTITSFESYKDHGG